MMGTTKLMTVAAAALLFLLPNAAPAVVTVYFDPSLVATLIVTLAFFLTFRPPPKAALSQAFVAGPPLSGSVTPLVSLSVVVTATSATARPLKLPSALAAVPVTRL